MAAAAMKHMASNFAKLDKFERVDFRRWQKNMHFLLYSISVVYVLTTPISDDGDDPTMDQLRKRTKWENDDYAKYMAEYASSKKFLVSNFTNYKMTDSRLVLEQYNKLLGILGRFTQHKMNMDESIQVSCIIDKLPPSWKDFKHTLKHLKEELTLVELGSHLCIEESLGIHDSDKPKGNNVSGLFVVNMVEHNNSSWYNDNEGKRKHHNNTKVDPNKKSKVTCWKCGKPRHLKKDCKGGKDGNKEWFRHKWFSGWFYQLAERFCYVYLLHSKDEAIDKFKVFKLKLNYNKVPKSKDLGLTGEGCRAVVRLPDPKLKTLGERGIECIFVGYAENSKAFRCYVIEPNDSVSINSIIKSMDAIFDENRLSSVPRPSLRILNRTEDIGGSVVPKEVTEKKEANNDEMDSIMGNNTWVLACLPPGCKPIGCKWIFKRKLKVDGAIEKFKAMLVIHGFKQKSRINYFDTYALVMDVRTTFFNGDLDEEAPKQWHQKFVEVVLSNGYLLNQADKCVYNKFDETGKGVIICLYAVSQLDYSRVIGCLMYAITCIRPGIAFAVGKLSRYTSNPGTQPWQAIQWASKKQTCITGSTMKSEFVAIATAGKEVEWLKNLLFEIPLWSKPIAPISIRCDSAATLQRLIARCTMRSLDI
nr:zinc finger, CCHC-type [Tanacetum cinerariifolium]